MVLGGFRSFLVLVLKIYCPHQLSGQRGETKTDKQRTKFEYSAGFAVLCFQRNAREVLVLRHVPGCSDLRS